MVTRSKKKEDAAETVFKLTPKDIFPYRPGDIVYLKKQHPCGSHEWEVLRIGSDLRLACVGCGRQIMVERRKVEKFARSVRRKGEQD